VLDFFFNQELLLPIKLFIINLYMLLGN